MITLLRVVHAVIKFQCYLHCITDIFTLFLMYTSKLITSFFLFNLQFEHTFKPMNTETIIDTLSVKIKHKCVYIPICRQVNYDIPTAIYLKNALKSF